MNFRKVVKSLPYPLQTGIKHLYSTLPPRFRYGKVFWETYNFLQESQWWSREKLEEYQMDQLSKLLNHAYKNVPYYKKVFDERGLKPKDVQDFNDLKKLPFLTKTIIERHKKEFLSIIHNNSQIIPMHTGGTTGSPLHFWCEKGISIPKERAFFWRMWNWHDYHWSDRCLVIAGSYEVEEKIQYDPLDKTLYLYNPVVTISKIREYLKIVEEFRPKIIRGYPSLLYIFAHLINQHQIKIKWPFLQIIFCNSEKLFDFQRQEISKVFNCKVVDHYGHNEMLVLMQKCEENQNYHVISEYGITEIIGEDGEVITKEGGIGEIVGTGFNNFAFPMVRYRTGDWAKVTKETCKCGRNYVLVKDVIGRSGDFILTPSGKLVPPTNLEFAIRHIKNFKDVQIVQTDIDLIEIQIVPSVYYNVEEGKRFAENVKVRIGEEMNVKITLTDKIERPYSQKRRFVHSEIAKQFLDNAYLLNER